MGLLELIPSILGLFSQIFPNASQAEHDKFQLALQVLLTNAETQQAQLKVDEAEASNPNLFVAGWRPMIGWGLGGAMVIYVLLTIVINFGIALGYHFITVPQLDPMITNVVMSMLGINIGARTWEKIKGVQGKH